MKLSVLFLSFLCCGASAEYVCPLADPIQIEEDVTLEQVANPAEGTFTMRLTYYGGQSWIGIGINHENSNNMTPSTAVIGRMDNGTPSVLKYDLTSDAKDASGVVPMAIQNLQNVRFEQTDTTSVLEFTQLLDEETQTVTSDSVWIYAVGLPDNQWAGKHQIHGAFQLTAMDELCVEVAGPVQAPVQQPTDSASQPTEVVAAQPTEPTNDVSAGGNDEDDSSEETEDDSSGETGGNQDATGATNAQTGIVQIQSAADDVRSLWVAHGLLMALAWGVCAPLAIGAVMLRNVSFLATKGRWYKLHFYANICNILFTTVGFFLAVAAMNKEGEDHFTENTHTKAGLAIFLIVLFQFALAFLRPDPPKAPSPSIKSIDTPQDTEHSNNSTPRASGIEHAVTVVPPSYSVNDSEEVELGEETASETSSEQDMPAKSKVRFAWEISHRFIGITLLGLAWYNCTSGIQLQSEKYDERDDLTAIFWGVTAGISGLIFFLAYVVRV